MHRRNDPGATTFEAAHCQPRTHQRNEDDSCFLRLLQYWRRRHYPSTCDGGALCLRTGQKNQQSSDATIRRHQSGNQLEMGMTTACPGVFTRDGGARAGGRCSERDTSGRGLSDSSCGGGKRSGGRCTERDTSCHCLIDSTCGGEPEESPCSSGCCTPRWVNPTQAATSFTFDGAALTHSQAKTATPSRPAEMPLLRHPCWRSGPRGQSFYTAKQVSRKSIGKKNASPLCAHVVLIRTRYSVQSMLVCLFCVLLLLCWVFAAVWFGAFY